MDTHLDLAKHPCFNRDSAGCSGRIHLPVAPRCNVQCKYCNRKFDCANETRPGVTSRVLAPREALAYLEQVMARNSSLSVVGIAGPGDPFANPLETMETLRLVRQRYPSMLLCVSTNGLEIGPHLDELQALGVSHLTITLNTIRPATAARIYAWLRIDKHTQDGQTGGPVLLARQLAAMREIKRRGMLLKVNFILLPGINDQEVLEVAATARQQGADLFNLLPYCQAPGCHFEDLPEPSAELVAHLRQAAAEILPQMTHCARCRADAVGLLGDDRSGEYREWMAAVAENEPTGILPPLPALPAADPARPWVAVASREGLLVNQHLGEASTLTIFSFDGHRARLVEHRATPDSGGGEQRWLELASRLSDCRALVVTNLGDTPRRILVASQLEVITAEGMIEEVVERIFTNRPLNHLISRDGGCSTCVGSGKGCGA